MTAEIVWAQLPYAWSRFSYCSVCIKDIDILFIEVWEIHWPQELEVFLYTEEVEYDAKMVVGIGKGLQLQYQLPFW